MTVIRSGIFGGVLLGALAFRPRAANADAVPRILTMSGHGSAEGVPDTVQISAGVTVQARTAAEALAADNMRMTHVFAALKAKGVPDRAIQTSEFSVSPQYPSNNSNLQTITGYEVTNRVTVTLNDVTKLGQTLDALVAAGANQMNGIVFSIRDSAALLTSARQAAVADATAKAKIYAKAAGVTLGPILSISENGSEEPRPMMLGAARMGKFTPTAAGEQSLGANATIIWEIQ